MPALARGSDEGTEGGPLHYGAGVGAETGFVLANGVGGSHAVGTGRWDSYSSVRGSLGCRCRPGRRDGDWHVAAPGGDGARTSHRHPYRKKRRRLSHLWGGLLG